jgi:hypothetical protein
LRGLCDLKRLSDWSPIGSAHEERGTILMIDLTNYAF